MDQITDTIAACSMDDMRELSFPELDELRRRLNMSKYAVCKRARISEALYWRWTQWAQGDARGCRPGRRTLDDLRRELLNHINHDNQHLLDISAGRPVKRAAG